MPEKYPIATVREDTIRLQEHMGSKRKFWYREREDSNRFWLFKFPNDNSGEHWAEKIAAEVAAVLDFEHARVELAMRFCLVVYTDQRQSRLCRATKNSSMAISYWLRWI